MTNIDVKYKVQGYSTTYDIIEVECQGDYTRIVRKLEAGIIFKRYEERELERILRKKARRYENKNCTLIF